MAVKIKYTSFDITETKDSTPTIVSSFTLPTNFCCSMDVTTIARSSNFDVVVDRRIYIIKNINDVLSISNDVVNLCNKQGDASLSTTNSALVIDGTSINVQVTGIDNTDIVWSCNINAIAN